jgi:hypothetical protein
MVRMYPGGGRTDCDGLALTIVTGTSEAVGRRMSHICSIIRYRANRINKARMTP